MKLKLIVLLCLGIGVLSTCKPRRAGNTQGSVLMSSDDYPAVSPMSTPDLHKYLTEKVEAQTAEGIMHEGNDPSKDVWDYYIDPVSVSKIQGFQIESHREYFGMPTAELRFPDGTPLPDPCPEENKLERNGKKLCLVMDNMMRYSWKPKGVGTYHTDPKKWHVNVIPQFYGQKQPAMERFMKGGDIVVYFHPEYQGDVSTLAQWRTTHAATVLKRESDGRLMTIDTPAGYAKAFNGVDATPFHVYRFVPRDFQDWTVVDEYAKQIERWGTLAFAKFPFNGNYASMANEMRTEADIDKFVNYYLKSANSPEGSRAMPGLYCAWYAWTNLTLAWMRPMSPQGLGESLFSSLEGKKFTGLVKSHSFGDGDFNQSYAVSKSLSGRLSKRNSFAVVPMTAPELLLGMLDRTVGRDVDAKSPIEFVSKAKAKAAILTGMAQSSSALSSLAAEPRTEVVANEKTSQIYNEQLKTSMLAFAGQYSTLADQVIGGKIETQDAVKKINDEFVATVKKEWTTNLKVSRKWIPPYGFMHHAEYGYQNYNVQDKGQPVLVYVGTVVHEKYLRKKGTPVGKTAFSIQKSTPMSPQDKDLDKQIYKTLGCAESDDGNGWKVLLKKLSGESVTGCSFSEQVVQFNDVELDAVNALINNWSNSDSLSERQIYVRNTFGLDTTIVRRMLVSFWNDPTIHFKPSIYEGEASTLESAAGNLKLLLHDEALAMNEKQAPIGKYDTEGHPRRENSVRCTLREPAASRTCLGIRSAGRFSDAADGQRNNPDIGI